MSKPRLLTKTVSDNLKKKGSGTSRLGANNGIARKPNERKLEKKVLVDKHSVSVSNREPTPSRDVSEKTLDVVERSSGSAASVKPAQDARRKQTRGMMHGLVMSATGPISLTSIP